MIGNVDALGLITLIISAVVLGSSIVLDVSRVCKHSVRRKMLTSRLAKYRGMKDQWHSLLNQKKEQLTVLQAKTIELTARYRKAQKRASKIKQKKNELIHEIGSGPMVFWSALSTRQNFDSIARSDMIVSRQIWDYRNVSHVWAHSADQADIILRTVFPERTGIAPSPVVPLAEAPDWHQDNDEELML